MNDTVKQVIVMRNDLGMRKGKMIAQGCHSSISFLTRKLQSNRKMTDVEQQWVNDRFTKICVRVDSEQELIDIHNKALANGIESHLITDAGYTEFNGMPTKTCLALGPDYASKIDVITGHLKLL
jgi:PTH2 family peptidyl-tRNA hydrolase